MNIPRPIHPFPARMATSIPWNILEKLPRDRRHRILDPMAGSGTTIVVARKLGHEAIGVDSDPLAVIIGSAWCGNVNEERLARFVSAVTAKARANWRSIVQGAAYPHGADAETRAFVRYWFDTKSRRQLTALANAIQTVTDRTARNLLWCGFSRLIIVKTAGASLAMDVAHSRPHRAYARAPIEPVEHFPYAMQRVLSRSPFKAHSAHVLPAATMRIGDARRLPIDDQTIDIIITSPPYLNAIDYLRGHKLSLVWMNHLIGELRGVRATNIGAQSGCGQRLESDSVLQQAFDAGVTKGVLPSAQTSMFVRFLSDMRTVLYEIRRVLKRDGQAALVIGDCSVRGTFVRNSEAIKILASHAGLTLASERTRSLPSNRRYLPPPQARNAGKDLSKRLRREVILKFVVRKQRSAFGPGASRLRG